MCFVCQRKLDWYCLLPKGLKKWPMFLPTYIYGCVEKRMWSYIVLYIKFFFFMNLHHILIGVINFIHLLRIINKPHTIQPSFSWRKKEGSLNANEMVTKYPSPINWILCVFISSNMCLSQPKRNILLRSPELLRI